MATEDNEIEEEFEEEGEDEESPLEEEAHRPKKRGRKPGSRNKPKDASVPPAAAAPGITAMAGEPDPNSPPTWGDDPRTVWPLLVEYCISHGYTNVPDAVSINLSRQSASPGYTGPMQTLPSIPVSAVLGDERTDPGEALMRYIIHVYHLGSDRPARYELRFLYRPNRSRLIKSAHVDLADPREIAAAQSRAASMQASQAYQGPAVYGMGAPMMPPMVPMAPPGAQGGYMHPSQAPQPQQLPQVQPQGQPQPQVQTYNNDPGVQQAVEGMRRELAMVFGAMSAQQQAEAARQLGMGAPPPVAPPTAPQSWPTPPQSQVPPAQQQAEMIAATVAATLRALGMGAPPPAPLPPAPPPYNPYVVQQQQAARQIGLGDLVTDLKGQVAAFREFGKIKRDFESLGNLFGAEQEEEPPPAAAPIVPAIDPNAPPFAVRKIPFSGSPLSGGQDINWVDQYTTDADGERVKKPLQEWAMQLSAANPQLTANMIEQLTRIIDNSSIGSLVKKFAESGAAAAQQTAARAPAALGAGAMPNGATQPGGYSPP